MFYYHNIVSFIGQDITGDHRTTLFLTLRPPGHLVMLSYTAQQSLGQHIHCKVLFWGKTNPCQISRVKYIFQDRNYKCESKSVTGGGWIMFLRRCEDKMIVEMIQFSDMIWFSPKTARGEILTKYQRYFWILYIENIPPQKLGSFHPGPTPYICQL